MKKAKKTALAVVIVVFLLAALWLYWEREIPLMQTIPEGSWKEIQIHKITFREYEVFTLDDTAEEALLAAMQETTVTRREKFTTLDGNAFLIWLVPEDPHAPTQLVLREDGGCSVSDFGTDSHYYEGAQKLYEAIQAITETLPGENLWEE